MPVSAKAAHTYRQPLTKTNNVVPVNSTGTTVNVVVIVVKAQTTATCVECAAITTAHTATYAINKTVNTTTETVAKTARKWQKIVYAAKHVETPLVPNGVPVKTRRT